LHHDFSKVRRMGQTHKDNVRHAAKVPTRLKQRRKQFVRDWLPHITREVFRIAGALLLLRRLANLRGKASTSLHARHLAAISSLPSSDENTDSFTSDDRRPSLSRPGLAGSFRVPKDPGQPTDRPCIVLSRLRFDLRDCV
jgi:hypothetical protein